jgi:hypothetical protein
LDIDSTKTKTVHDILPTFKLEAYSKQKSALPTHWQTVLEKFTNTSVYRAAMNNLGKYSSTLPFQLNPDLDLAASLFIIAND